MTRNFANRFNHRYGNVFPEPYAFNFGEDLVKVPALDGSGKMSKSENQYATIFLSDDDDLIRKKIMKALTDVAPTVPGSPKTPNIANLFQLLELVSQPDTVKKFDDDYTNCTIRYGDLKKQLAEDMIRLVAPIREKSKLIFDDKDYLKQIMANGAAKARESAKLTLDLVRNAMGLDYF
jgi:tryptophanyl-tRNA synthetase